MRRLMIMLALAQVALPASASTPAAWEQLQRQSERSCIVASRVTRAQVSRMIVFDDATGVVALLVTGRALQPHMKGTKVTNLCLYNRKTRKAAIEEAAGWEVRP